MSKDQCLLDEIERVLCKPSPESALMEEDAILRLGVNWAMLQVPRDRIAKAIYELRWQFMLDEFTNRDVLLLQFLTSCAHINLEEFAKRK